MATIRVFLLTYRRPELLKRAVASLRAQTFGDWACELHNDDPSDSEPGRLIERLGDPRFTLVQHPTNEGAVRSFNRVFGFDGPEPFFTLLEDDNWWEPEFLATLLAALSAHPRAQIAWSNVRYWREEPDRSWTDTGRSMWPHTGEGPVTIGLPQLIQCDGPLVSNGSMLLRREAAASKRLVVPQEVSPSIQEQVREARFPAPLVLVSRPLSHFALTQSTARTGAIGAWMGLQTAEVAAFLSATRLGGTAAARLWESRRKAVPRATAALFFAGIATANGAFLRHASVRDWLLFLASCARHPGRAVQALRGPGRHRALRDWFEKVANEMAPQWAGVTTVDFPPLSLAVPSDLAAGRPT